MQYQNTKHFLLFQQIRRVIDIILYLKNPKHYFLHFSTTSVDLTLKSVLI